MSIELIEVEILSRQDQGAGIAVFDLAATSGEMLPSFSAGAHVDVHVNENIVRQYSLCNPPGESNSYRIGVLNDPNSRGGSLQIHQEFQPGKLIKISEPRNHFSLDETQGRIVLAGGGIGITPLIAMAYELTSMGKKFELHYCTRTRGAGAFVDELKREFPGSVFFHYDDEDKSQLFDPKTTFEPYDKSLHIYVCGPTGFMDWVISSAKSLDYPSPQIHFEYFSADVDTTGNAFEVYCAESDVTVQVQEGQSIVSALKEVGVKVDVSCEEGVCGTCITDVLEGEPDHRDHFLNDEEKAENDQMALCCSRSKSNRLVLDI